MVKYLLFVSLCFVFSSGIFAQSTNGDDQPVYLRYPTIPQFTIYQAPDSTAFTRDDLKKKTPVIFFVFSPECSHCKHETEMMLANIDKLKHTQIVMVTYLPYSEMMDFYKHYQISKYPQITMGRDAKFFFPVFFKIKNFPSFYIYDKKGNFKQFLEGDVKIETLVNALKN